MNYPENTRGMGYYLDLAIRDRISELELLLKDTVTITLRNEYKKELTKLQELLK